MGKCDIESRLTSLAIRSRITTEYSDGRSTRCCRDSERRYGFGEPMKTGEPGELGDSLFVSWNVPSSDVRYQGRWCDEFKYELLESGGRRNAGGRTPDCRVAGMVYSPIWEWQDGRITG